MYPSNPNRVVVAVGGNAIHPEHEAGTAEQQADLADSAAAALLPLCLSDQEVLLTHGNGPVVGKILMRQALASGDVPPMPMDVCVAHSQGGIAYLLMRSLENALRRQNNVRNVVCLLTQVEVDENDPAFSNPQKPVGFFYTQAQASEIQGRLGWTLQEDAGRGWRYVVPSPQPRHVADIAVVDTVLRNGAIAIAGGGGGIPVVRDDNGTRRGVNAVIDKDLTAALMARLLGAETLIILTAVDSVRLNFGRANESVLEDVAVADMRAFQSAGHFAAGSMGPKVEAALRFVEGGGRRAVIAHLNDAAAAYAGRAGTRIHLDAS
jgi:carbamate kinase